jgi:hypothetical protein
MPISNLSSARLAMRDLSQGFASGLYLFRPDDQSSPHAAVN